MCALLFHIIRLNAILPKLVRSILNSYTNGQIIEENKRFKVEMVKFGINFVVINSDEVAGNVFGRQSSLR